MIESGQAPDARSEAVEKIDREHDNIVTEHIQQLKSAFGETRFKVLDDYVRSGKFRKDLILAILRPAAK